MQLTGTTDSESRAGVAAQFTDGSLENHILSSGVKWVLTFRNWTLAREWLVDNYGSVGYKQQDTSQVAEVTLQTGQSGAEFIHDFDVATKGIEYNGTALADVFSFRITKSLSSGIYSVCVLAE